MPDSVPNSQVKDWLLLDYYASQDNHNPRFRFFIWDFGGDVVDAHEDDKEDPNEKPGRGTTTDDRQYRFSRWLKGYGISASTSDSHSVKGEASALSDMKRHLADGKSVVLHVYPVKFHCRNGTVRPIQDGGHAVTVVGVSESGVIEVSSWGEHYYVHPQEYDRALSLLLERTLGIGDLDAELEARGVPGYDVRPGDPADTLWEWYRSRSHLSSPYLYLRNNLRIERLSAEDIASLRSLAPDGGEGREALVRLAGRTYREVTSYRPPQRKLWGYDGRVMYCDRGNHNIDDPGTNYAPAECLVLWLSFNDGRLRDRTLSTDEINDLYWNNDVEWEIFIKDEVIPAYEPRFSGELGYPVRIFLHDNPITTQEYDELG